MVYYWGLTKVTRLFVAEFANLGLLTAKKKEKTIYIEYFYVTSILNSRL